MKRVSLYKAHGYVRQVGHTTSCAKKGCGKKSQWRVILGKWHIQAYVCTTHLEWGVKLDMISETTGYRLGWERGYRISENHYEGRSTKVIPCMPKISSTQYGRPVEISGQFPNRKAPVGKQFDIPIGSE